MPDLGNGVELICRPEACEVVVGKEADQGVVMVLVDGDKGMFLRFRGRGLGAGEGFVRVAPFLGEVRPGDGRGEKADGCWDGGQGGVEGEGGLVGEGVGDGGAPVYEGTEDLLMVLVSSRRCFETKGIRFVCCMVLQQRVNTHVE